MKKMILTVAVLLGMTQVSMARQLLGEAKDMQVSVAQQLEVSQSRVKAWPNGTYKVYASAIGANDTQRDDVICAGQVEAIEVQAVGAIYVAGNLTHCKDVVAALKIQKED